MLFFFLFQLIRCEENANPFVEPLHYVSQFDNNIETYSMCLNDKDFGYEAWSFRSPSHSSRSADNKTATVQPGTNADISPLYFRYLVQVPANKLWTHIEVQCPAPYEQSEMEQAQCFITYNQETPNGRVQSNRASSPLGQTKRMRLERLLNSTSTIALHLINNHPSKPFIFSPPKIYFFSYPAHSFEITKTKDHNVQKFTATIDAINQTIELNTMILNASFVPIDIMTEYVYSPLPIIANGTHIIGFDIYDERFTHPWRNNGEFFTMKIRPHQTFTLSIYLVEHKSSNYYAALDHWYSLFPEIYYEQKYGIGTWVAFMTQERYNHSGLTTDFMGKYYWNNHGQKGNYKEFYYVEQLYTFFNDIQYDQDPVILENRLKECSLNSSVTEESSYSEKKRKKECELVVKYGLRGPDGNFNCIVDRTTTFAILSYLSEEMFEYKFHDAFEAIQNGLSIGIGFDSLWEDRWNLYNTDYYTSNNIYPFLCVDDDNNNFIPSIMFTDDSVRKAGFKDNMANSGIISPQIVKYMQTFGSEIATNKDNGNVILSTWEWKYWYIRRYLCGSRPMSNVENVDMERASKAAESYFSLSALFGIIPSYYHDNSGIHFWNNDEYMEKLRPVYKKWNSIFYEVFENAILYANRKGMIKETKANVTMWCKNDDDDCYLVALVGDEGEISFELVEGNVECIFKADDVDVEIDDKKITLKSNKSYRAAFFKFKKGLSGGEIAAIVIVVLVVVAAAIGGYVYFFVLKKKNVDEEIVLDKAL
ncbi:hypothetical protein GPJ56_001261 [Histomonas meleagridis]|uniref:uncharacterized protein n=1 Tax=Histomonas meleagridis TaxID=135588 RepID=UPI0035597A82|nr:hypothetical protein GPJ56_001261 [Histomonas meleagridis]KAH0797609.1 hypothetical protein GO595_009238 [Histomonas meleagridis]